MSGRSIVVDGVEYRIGDKIPVAKPKLVVRPARQKIGAQSVRNIFTKGRT